jgi:phosphate acyltransferase
VTDGFVGNIVLKTCEGMGKSIVRLLKRELSATPLRQLGALLARQGFKNILHRMNPDVYGGAPLLGLHGNVIKAHGSARELAISNAIRVSIQAIQHHLHEMIQQELAQAAPRWAAGAAHTPTPVPA